MSEQTVTPRIFHASGHGFSEGDAFGMQNEGI